MKKKSNPIILTFAGDFIPNDKTLKLIREGRSNEFAPEVTNIIKRSDYSIVNLETPLTIKENPIEKLGNNFMAHPDNVQLIKNLGFNSVTLANNHILDQNEQGVFDTINTCESIGIKTVGAGKNLEEAKKPLIIEIKNKKIGIINLCEQEFSIATESTAGANPFSAIEGFYQITGLKKSVDFIVVVFHGGLEHHHIPLPGFIKNCKFMIDCGADAVVCHHTHVINGAEIYKRKPVIYGIGNYFVEYKKIKPKSEYLEGWLLSLIINDDEITFNAMVLKNRYPNIGLTTNDKIKGSHEIISSMGKDYLSFSISASRYIGNKFLMDLMVKNRIIRILLKKILLNKNVKLFNRYVLINYLRCESLREKLIAVLIKNNK